MDWWYDEARQMLRDKNNWQYGYSQTWWLVQPNWFYP